MRVTNLRVGFQWTFARRKVGRRIRKLPHWPQKRPAQLSRKPWIDLLRAANRSERGAPGDLGSEARSAAFSIGAGHGGGAAAAFGVHQRSPALCVCVCVCVCPLFLSPLSVFCFRGGGLKFWREAPPSSIDLPAEKATTSRAQLRRLALLQAPARSDSIVGMPLSQRDRKRVR